LPNLYPNSGPQAFLQIELSLDGLGKDHDFIRGVDGNFRKFLDTYQKLLNLKREYKNLKVKINTTISKFNQRKMNGILNFVERKLSVDSFSASYPHGNPREPGSIEIDLNLYKQILQKLDKMRRFDVKCNFINMLFRAVHSTAREVILNSIVNAKKIYTCTATKKIIVINEIGDVFPCEPLFGYKLGNLRGCKYDIKSILKSGKTKQFYESKIKKEECYCTWSCAALSNIVFSPKAYIEVLTKAIRQMRECFKGNLNNNSKIS